MFRYLSLFALATLAQVTPPAGAEQQEPHIVVSVAAEHGRCNASSATKVRLQAMAREPRRWEGKCVAVDGYWQQRALFSAARDARKRYAQSNNSVSPRRVGIYGTERVLASAPRTAAAYTAIGIAGRCETLAEGAIMVMGYCHYTGGPYIAVAEMHRRWGPLPLLVNSRPSSIIAFSRVSFRNSCP